VARALRLRGPRAPAPRGAAARTTRPAAPTPLLRCAEPRLALPRLRCFCFLRRTHARLTWPAPTPAWCAPALSMPQLVALLSPGFGLRPRPRGSGPRLRAAHLLFLSRARSRQVMQAQMQDAAEDAAEAASQAAGEALSQLGTAAADGAASAAVGLGQAVVDASVAAAPVVLDGLKAAVPVVRLMPAAPALFGVPS